jgi:sugar phosphate isomerase/epimerase
VRPASVHCTFGPEYDLSSLDAATHVRALGAVRDALDLAVALGAPIVVLHASSEPVADPEREARMQQTLALLSQVTPELRSAGLVGALELLPRTCLCHSLAELTWFLDRLDPALFGVCLDVNHAMTRYAALPDMIRALGPRLIATHLSDYDGVDEKHWLPGRGVIDWAALLRALAEIDYRGPFNFECPGDGQTAAERVRSYEVNFRWLGELLSRIRGT